LQLSVIIVNYNVKYFTEQCLYSVVKACKNIEAEIFVVDNHSADGSYDYLNNQFANVHFIWNRKNTGFAKANNVALQEASGEYVLFLNPDTIVPEDCLEKCVAFYQDQKNIGAMGIRMIDGKGDFLKESKRGIPSISTSFFKLSGLAALFPRSPTFARYYIGNMPDNVNQPVPVLSGAFMMAERKIINSVRGFDETFFMYGEDIDLSYRIQKAGYNNYYFAESTIIHFKGESTKKGTLYVRLFYNAMNVFVEKHYAGIKKATYQLLINLAKGLKIISTSIAVIFFADKNNGKKNISQSKPALLFGLPVHCEGLKMALEQANAKFQVAAMVDTSNNLLANKEQLQALISEHGAKAIIFCMDDVSAKEVISAIQNIAPSVDYFFNYAGSGCVVGSSNKNQRGDWIVLK
jgi:N-acetylglucosaminyl-diphospho-decaprenol L-rhamnosyltransferase